MSEKILVKFNYETEVPISENKVITNRIWIFDSKPDWSTVDSRSDFLKYFDSSASERIYSEIRKQYSLYSKKQGLENYSSKTWIDISPDYSFIFIFESARKEIIHNLFHKQISKFIRWMIDFIYTKIDKLKDTKIISREIMYQSENNETVMGMAHYSNKSELIFKVGGVLLMSEIETENIPVTDKDKEKIFKLLTQKMYAENFGNIENIRKTA